MTSDRSEEEIDMEEDGPERDFPEEDSLGFSVHGSTPAPVKWNTKNLLPPEEEIVQDFPEEDSLGFSYSKEAASSGVISKSANLPMSYGIQSDDDEELTDYQNPSAPVQLAILGNDDDLSTIAGESVATAGAVLSKANISSGNAPVQRDFKEYESASPAQKKNRWGQKPEKKPLDSLDQLEAADEAAMKGVKQTKKIYVYAIVAAVALIVTISALAIAYAKLSKKDDNSKDGAFSPTDFAAWTNAPTMAPVPVPTEAPFVVPPAALEDLKQILADEGVDVASIEDAEGTPQYRSLRWLAADPAYFEYTDNRLVQRWALGVFAYGLKTGSAQELTLASTLEGWLDYDTSECEWFSTTTGRACNGFGYYENLELAEVSAYGTLPDEIVLLAESLKTLNLTGNYIEGTLPTVLLNLTLLETLDLTENLVSGEIPSDLGLLSSVTSIRLQSNSLTGTIPTELANLDSLTELNLSHNHLTGNIPEEFGLLEQLEVLALEGNNLNGTIPKSLGDLDGLMGLEVAFNSLSGDVPREVCDLTLETLYVDCHVVACDCCTQCSPTASPTAYPTSMPSVRPTGRPTTSPSARPTPAATDAPTKRPTRSPTASPTDVCVPSVEWADDCVAIGQEIDINFVNCDPEVGDWIGIYDKNSDATALDTAPLWTYTCGGQSGCVGTPKRGTVTLGESEADRPNDWPLKKSDYFAYLIRSSETEPYEPLVGSEKMKIKNDSC
eukprot:Nitzschia sp. Nitz4//scaffold101_size76361//23145//25622//NITZ4_005598-RA/size76361-augustus-gene-0.8-mRNA-1//-1//CDS//3329532146//7696//frame0